jgi:hypothetical protein
MGVITRRDWRRGDARYSVRERAKIANSRLIGSLGELNETNTTFYQQLRFESALVSAFKT